MKHDIITNDKMDCYASRVIISIIILPEMITPPLRSLDNFDWELQSQMSLCEMMLQQMNGISMFICSVCHKSVRIQPEITSQRIHIRRRCSIFPRTGCTRNTWASLGNCTPSCTTIPRKKTMAGRLSLRFLAI